ncbi:hypothetical protein GOODEAATRI_024705 [Goodea atripinnis]|uniref:Uncharacterized protein n=1 Tax=Goodea atripinnis TaxID=208336 RepID=A0ABV0PGX7_9TELE
MFYEYLPGEVWYYSNIPPPFQWSFLFHWSSGIGEAQRANVSLLANKHNSSTGSASVIRSSIRCTKLKRDELLFVYLVFIHKKGKLRYKQCFTFSLRPADAHCVPEKSPVETLSLRSRVERFFPV